MARSVDRFPDAAVSSLTFVAAAVSAVLFYVSYSPGAYDFFPAGAQRAALLLLLAVAVYWLLQILRAAVRRKYLTSWWDPSSVRADGPLSWDQVLRLVSGSLSSDPLEHRPTLRLWPLMRWSIGYVLVLIALFSLASFLFTVVLDPGLPKPLSRGALFSPSTAAQGNVSSGAGLAAYVALAASLFTAAFAYHLLRARVRADNRQKWIGRARRLLGEVTALLAAHQLEKNDQKRKDLWLRADVLRLELELMLNPSEKDHRLLLYLVQRLAFLNWKDGGENYHAIQERIQDAVNLRLSIHRDCVRARRAEPSSPQPTDQRPDVGRAWSGILYCDDAVELISYILRLSHVVLKREWERVKHTR